MRAWVKVVKPQGGGPSTLATTVTILVIMLVREMLIILLIYKINFLNVGKAISKLMAT